jgi:hypothetical protein
VSTLAGTLSLGDGPGRIEDVEALVRKVVDDRLRMWGARLNQIDHEDLVSYLIGVCWELSGRYDPAKDRNPNFATYAARILTLRVADWYRQRFGDTRHGERPIVLSLDAPATLSSGDGDEEDGRGRLVDSLPSREGDPADDRTPDLVGILGRGSGDEAGPHDTLGEPASRRARGGDRTPAQVKPRIPGTKKPTVEVPVCPNCAKVFLSAFDRVNRALPEEKRVGVQELAERARHRARAVKLHGEWVCPRCTTLPTPDGSLLFVQQVYPNRRARRAVGTASRTNSTRRRKTAT